MSRSDYYKWLNKIPSKRSVYRQTLIKVITKIYRDSKCRYGSPRVSKELNMQGFKASEVLVAKIMKELHLKSIVRKRYKVTTDSSHKYQILENVLNREFIV